MLGIVDNRTFRRLVYEVLDRNPTKEDVEAFFGRFKAILDEKGLSVRGVTTDGSPLYPDPIARVFGEIPHQLCQFHVLAELTRAVLKAVTKVRRSLQARMPGLPRGRPARKDVKRAMRNKRLRKKVADLFENRYLFVRHDLSAAHRRKLTRLTRGLPELHTLRAIMDEVYRLFDRRCRTETALAKFAKLRARVRRFKKVATTLKMLFSPNLEKALTFLDDFLLPATSNAAERGYRRYRKMQKTVYRIRRRHTLIGRLALDHVRDRFAGEHALTLRALHRARRHRPENRERPNPIPFRNPTIRASNLLPQTKAS